MGSLCRRCARIIARIHIHSGGDDDGVGGGGDVIL